MLVIDTFNVKYCSVLTQYYKIDFSIEITFLCKKNIFLDTFFNKFYMKSCLPISIMFTVQCMYTIFLSGIYSGQTRQSTYKFLDFLPIHNTYIVIFLFITYVHTLYIFKSLLLLTIISTNFLYFLLIFFDLVLQP